MEHQEEAVDAAVPEEDVEVVHEEEQEQLPLSHIVTRECLSLEERKTH